MNKRTKKKIEKNKGLYINPRDTWALDITIAEFILPRLKLFKKLNNGYPGRNEETNTFEKWDNLLDKMIWSFEQIANNYEIYSNLVMVNNPNLQKEYHEIDDKIQEGLMLFAKYYQDLGW